MSLILFYVKEIISIKKWNKDNNHQTDEKLQRYNEDKYFIFQKLYAMQFDRNIILKNKQLASFQLFDILLVITVIKNINFYSFSNS